MLKIRLQRIGRRNNPAFRVVVTESTRGPKSGNNVELLGSYNPHSKALALNTERILYWIKNGAQVSDTVHNILVSEKVIDGAKKNVLPRKSPIVKEKVETTESTAQNEKAPVDESAPAEAPQEDTPQEEISKEKQEERESREKATEVSL